MMNKLLLSSGNKDKFAELRAKLSVLGNVMLLSPSLFGITMEVDENGTTLQENASLKAEAFYKLFRIPTLADDTGLFVNSLNGQPGVMSARYSGENATYESNRIKLLNELSASSDRSAEFKTVICLVVSETEKYFFEGICRGSITRSERGTGGFGYDSLFMPKGFDSTFAEMPLEVKNQISHRALALDKFISYLEEKKLLSTP
jgi:XTP/dITP diphosphohydrolase